MSVSATTQIAASFGLAENDLFQQALVSFLSEKNAGRYSYHWERRLIGAGDLYRHDNAPHNRWRRVATFPKHFHDGSENNVVESHISSNPDDAIREFLSYVRRKLVGIL